MQQYVNNIAYLNPIRWFYVISMPSSHLYCILSCLFLAFLVLYIVFNLIAKEKNLFPFTVQVFCYFIFQATSAFFSPGLNVGAWV